MPITPVESLHHTAATLLVLVQYTFKLRTAFLAIPVDDEHLVVVEVADTKGYPQIGDRLPRQVGCWGAPMRSGGPLLIEDIRHAPCFEGMEPIPGGELGAFIGAPIVATDGSTVGVLGGVDPDPRPFTPDDAETLVTLTRLLGFALVQHRLEGNLAMLGTHPRQG